LEPLLERVARTVERHAMFIPGQKVGVAVSGGADSVCLLFVLRELAPRWGVLLYVLHLDHRLRGEESAADAEFVRSLAAELGLVATVAHADVRSHGGNLEQAARNARLEFFRAEMAAGRVDRVALGHTRTDQAETVLFRLLRGTAGAGLSGIRPVTADGIVRPLLEIERPEVEAFLKGRGIGWREDSTNRSPLFARNRIRHSLLPQLAREWNPAIVKALAHTAEWALAEEAYWETEVTRLEGSLFRRWRGGIILQVSELRALPAAGARRLIRRAIERVKGDLRGIDFEHVSQILEVNGPGRARMPGVETIRSFDWLMLFPAGTRPFRHLAYSLPVSPPTVVEIPDSGTDITLELIENPVTPEGCRYVYNREMGCIDWPRVSGPLELRNWRPGDRYHPIGHTGEEKIKNLFQRARVPVWERSGWPVLTDGSGIIWTRRFGPAAGLSPDACSTTVLRIGESVKLESEMPARASIELG
jgi:tRNA(Ile)-lysidine synthase